MHEGKNRKIVYKLSTIVGCILRNSFVLINLVPFGLFLVLNDVFLP